MSAYISKNQNLGLSSSLKMGEEIKEMARMKQGIVSILGSDSAKSSKAPSLRRTLSADMLVQHGFFSPAKKTEEFTDSATNSSDGEEEDELGGQQRKESETKSGFDVWSAILNQKAREESGESTKPYVHPLVKRKTSSLSGKSLEICTESLGSETGSDGFSFSDGDAEEDKDEHCVQDVHQEKQEEKVHKLVKFGCLPCKKPSQLSFPPPIPSISRPDGASMFMRTRRDNGRLVLEAVSIPTEKNFCAQRQDGRLVLTFAVSNQNIKNESKESDEVEEEFQGLDDESESKKNDEEEEVDEEESEEEEGEEEEDQDEEEMNGMRFMKYQGPSLSSGLVNVHRLALMVNRRVKCANRNPNRSNEKAGMAEKADPPTLLAQSLPPRPPGVARPIPLSRALTGVAAASVNSSNAYNYYWRPEPIEGSVHSPNAKAKLGLTGMGNHEHGGGGGGGGGDEWGHWLKGCKEQKRSLLFCQPQCIAIN